MHSFRGSSWLNRWNPHLLCLLHWQACSLPLVPCESESEVTQSCPTLCDPMDCSLPGSSIHGIFQARMLEWVNIPFCRGSSRPRDRTQVNPGLLHCRQTLYHLSQEGHVGSPKGIQWSESNSSSTLAQYCLSLAITLVKLAEKMAGVHISMVYKTSTWKIR